jgi:hypothetical protein
VVVAVEEAIEVAEEEGREAAAYHCTTVGRGPGHLGNNNMW